MVKVNKIKYIIVMFVALVIYNLATSVYCANSYKPTSKFYINDFADILSDSTEEMVFNISKTVEEKTTAQVVVVTVPNMKGQDVESYATELFNKWKIGSKGKDNGILFLIAKDERKVRIEVGYGANGFLSAGKTGRILDDHALPYLKSNDYDAATVNTIKEIQAIVYSEYKIEGGFDNYKQQDESDSIIGIVVFIGMTIVIIILFIFSKKTGIPLIFFLGGRGGPFGGGSSGGGGSSRGF